MYRFSILFLLSLALLSLAAPLGATAIYVSGDQSGTWAADAVIVTAEVRVPPNMSLTINLGVEVLFSVYCKLIVDNGATLRAVGTAADSIRFDVLPPNTSWHGIRFLAASDSSRLEYCRLTHGSATGSGEDLKGGAIYCSSSSPTIRNSTIIQNSATEGGGVYCELSSPSISSNNIGQNSASSGGGGIYCEFFSPAISGNTISENGGGGISLGGGGLYTNCIVWFNAPSQIVGGGTPVTFSDIQDGWPGLGNITPYPAFMDTLHKDYRLQWGSPCIDSGNPYPIYNDPDGTRADMGAFYYDQRVMVRILLTPHAVPYVISEAGGSMDYTIRAFNRDLREHAATIWCDVTLPDSSVSGPVLGPVTVTLHPEALVEKVRTQHVPAGAPLGVYYYNAYAVVGVDTSKDSFMWGKVGPLAADHWWVEASVWTNTGESLESPLPSEAIRLRPAD
jgi:hypothetical protein